MAGSRNGRDDWRWGVTGESDKRMDGRREFDVPSVVRFDLTVSHPGHI